MLQQAQQGGVHTLTLAQPQRGNALGSELVEALLAAVKAVLGDGAVHTLVLRGEGKHFCTGLDLSDLATARDGDYLHRLVRIETLLALLWHAPIATVAVAQGRAWGAGADLFAVCERRIALPGSSFRFPGAQFGIVLGTRRLAERVGADHARAWVIEGQELNPEQALQFGLATAMEESALAAPKVEATTARAIRQATRADHRDADLAALVRSGSAPGLVQRIAAYRERLLAQAQK